jgi:hypothetical protein
MTGSESAYLALVLCAALIFMIVVAWVDWSALPYSVGSEPENEAEVPLRKAA